MFAGWDWPYLVSSAVQTVLGGAGYSTFLAADWTVAGTKFDSTQWVW